MREQVRKEVHAVVPAERLRAYQGETSVTVHAEDVDAMADAQARFMVAGPQRAPTDIGPDVWKTALEMLRGVLGRMWSAPPVVQRPLEPPARDRLAEVAVPTLVVNGLEDAPWIQQVSDILADGIPGAQRIDVPHGAHLLPVERHAEITEAIRTVALHEHRGR
jgi:pimeloyl-ACP methyl ester carboxylesterase